MMVPSNNFNNNMGFNNMQFNQNNNFQFNNNMQFNQNNNFNFPMMQQPQMINMNSNNMMMNINGT